MKKLLLSFLFLVAVINVSAQKVYFIYIQTENEQPFFVKMNEKLSSSTGSGYIILSKLVDSTYQFSIGFPQNKWPEQNFSVAVNKKDHGFLLKDFGEKGWGLFDLQSLTIQMAISGKATIEPPKMESKDISVFTEMLSKAADDPSLKDKPIERPKPEEKKADVALQTVPVKEEPKQVVTQPLGEKAGETDPMDMAKKEEPKAEIKDPVNTKPVEVKDATVVEKEEPKTEVKDSIVSKPAETILDVAAIKKEETKFIEPVVIKPTEQAVPVKEQIIDTEYKVSQVKKWGESSTTEGFGLVFIDDHSNGTRDTIRLIIPNPTPVVSISKEEPVDEKKFIKTNELPVKEVVTIEEKKPAVEVPKEKLPEQLVVKNACKVVATGDDFVRLRKKMAAVTTDDEMIAEAKKVYKVKCFSTWQLKNLGVLFLTDEGKYKFFDASYPFVTDAPAFGSLQNELKDEYYSTRFKAMLRN